ncbi:MAG TPA: hypothetical protein VFO55_08665 [Gemmatimonadaceae bacterium]|nr:hypothetical protein [Gemmatimonadaceae bacterium]
MRLTIALAALAALPVALAAQPRQEGIALRSGDIERLNPARVILDLRKALKLERSQVAGLDSLRRAFDREALTLADSVKRHQRAITTAPPLLRRPPARNPATRKDSLERAKLDSTNRFKQDRYFTIVTTGRRDLATTLLQLKDLFDGASVKARDVLTPDQQMRATLALDAAAEEFTRRLRLANIR